MHLFAEAALLGLASGPSCLASCGPVLLPALAAQGKGLGGTAGLLSVFLSGRLVGYLSFSVLAWAAGLAAPADPRSRALLFGLVDLSLAGVLVVYALAARRCPAAPAPSGLVSIEKRVRPWTPAALGLLTGLNICPPFVVAGARAAETRSLPAAAAFFLVFFVGTAIWSLPLVAVGVLRRLAGVAAVARITLLILAAWYAYLGIMALSWRFSHV
jgi:sulfite exporter TauE/SafE